VPLSIFTPSGDGTAPDFADFAPIDYGHAVRFDPYQAAADAIFYEADPEWRRRMRKRLTAEERSFGASLRRLRLQRQLRQSDFGDVPKKTIARIERGEVSKPHGTTLARIAGVLGVTPEEIESY
jgi:hypothetical protein